MRFHTFGICSVFICVFCQPIHAQRNFAPLPPDTVILEYCDAQLAPASASQTQKVSAEAEARTKFTVFDDIKQASDPDARKALRNAFLSSGVYAISKSHTSYWNNAAKHRAVFYFSTDTLIAATTAVIASAGGAGTKAALGAAATAFGAIRGAFSNDFDAGQSRTDLLVNMQVNASKNEDALRAKFTTAYADYSVEAACGDLQNLYLSGSERFAYKTISKTVSPAEDATSSTAPKDKADSGTPTKDKQKTGGSSKTGSGASPEKKTLE